MDFKIISLRLKKFREQKKISQEEAAETINLSKRTYLRYEKDLRSIKVKDLLLLVQSFKCSLNELIYGDEAENLKEDEKEIIMSYRKIGKKEKEYIKHLIKATSIKNELENDQKIFENSSKKLHEIENKQF